MRWQCLMLMVSLLGGATGIFQQFEINFVNDTVEISGNQVSASDRSPFSLHAYVVHGETPVHAHPGGEKCDFNKQLNVGVGPTGIKNIIILLSVTLLSSKVAQKWTYCERGHIS